jgi:O-antigen ligase
MSSFLITAGRWGGIATIILLVIALLKQLIAFVGFIMFAIKAALVLAFVALMLIIVVLMLRTRSQRRREEAEL